MLRDLPLSFECLSGSKPGTRIFRLTGPLTLGNMFELQAALRQDPQPALTILDLSGVPYMDSAGLGVVVNCHVHCQNKGATMALAGVNERVMEMFRMTRTAEIMTIVDTVAAAEA